MKGNLYYLIVEAWLQKVLSVMTNMHREIQWSSIRGYNELLLSFAEQLEKVPLNRYNEPMTKFINSNPGLESRFNKYFYFPDYTGEQLMAIFRGQCKKNGYTLSADAESAALKLFDELYAERDDNFGNGRDVRNCFEDMVVRQSNRVAAMELSTRDDLMTILPEDLEDEEE